jgi:putative tricarboxylic transport membrane protein
VLRIAGRVAAPLAGLLVSAGLLVATRGLDEVARGGQLGPGFWPRFILLGLALTCVAKLAAEARRRPAPPAQAGPAPVPVALPELSRAKLGAAIAAIVLYVLATPAVGFPLATAAFIGAFMALCGARSTATLAANALLGTIVLIYLFIKVVYLPLPKGEGPFEGLSLALYRLLGIF